MEIQKIQINDLIMFNGLHLKDPRYFQIIFLGLFVFIGLYTQGLNLPFKNFSLCLISAILIQWILSYAWSLKKASLLSACITALSISLLIRSNHLWPYLALPVIAILSKFIFRWRGQHFLNPANFCIVFALLFLPDVWLSNSFWGNHSSYSIWFIFLGLFIIQKTKVNLPSLAFLIFYFSLTALRTLYLGFEYTVWAHELNSSSLMIFTFFMLSDPKTSPSSLKLQGIYALSIASIAFTMKHLLFMNHAFFYSLAITCLIIKFVFQEKNTYHWSSAQLK